ncbi:hypothetical protein FZC35_02300 [Candidatus Cytomitobacter indipagum]|uniref:Uncharacterized protein n=1 Tax=Candidatus Cytomitobacter indipagum TaxID=2601575 RepID=A0A5C0UEK1_9PROT|nr:hypothetical protein FZC35_02300 [Candidatus Cytomitobacter indipagum]
MSTAEYNKKYDLTQDYTVIAPNYSDIRKNLHLKQTLIIQKLKVKSKQISILP